MKRSRGAVSLRVVGGPRRARVVGLGARRRLRTLIGIGIFAVVLVGLATIPVSRSVAESQALGDSERMTERLADLVVEPLLPGYLRENSDLDGELHRTVRDRMADGDLIEVTVWSAQGRVLYSSSRLDAIGKVVEPPPDDLDAVLAGETISAFEDDAPEADAAPDRANGPLRYVEVYTPLRLPDGQRMALETYYDYERVDALADRLLKQTLPLVLVPLLVLQLVQIPVALSLTRRLKRHENERSRLLEAALDVADRERVRFAADLHDGPIQDLAGIGYALGAVAPTVAERHAPLMARVQDGLQRSIQSLRGLMTDLYPPDLRSGNLDQTILTLAEGLRTEGKEVHVEIGELPTLGEEAVSALYRVLREGLANVQKHGQASTVRISLGSVAAAEGKVLVRLVVADDGVGVDPSRLDRRAEGHLGLRLLADRLESLGGQLAIASAVGHGTSVTAELPVLAHDGS